MPAERATGIDDFSRICDGGAAFRGSPPYQGKGPHPLVLYPNGAPEAAYTDATGPSRPASPDGVQLVVCTRSVDSGPQTALRTCHYEGGKSATVFEGHWRFDVYEARTGRKVTSIAVNSDSSAECRPVMPFVDGSSTTGYDEPPGDAQYALLDPLVAGPAR